MPEILRKNGFVVCIYCERGGRHHLPHCHLSWGDEEAVISLRTLRKLAGDDVPANGVEIMVENMELLVEKWDELNGRTESAKEAQAHRKQAKK